MLGYDKTYISMIETRRRFISDVAALRRIAQVLGIPEHTLGVTEADDATFAAMLQFANSILTLADVARQSGRAVDAIDELWPLVVRLEARAAEGLLERESLALLGRARLALGVALGSVLPDEKLASAARWTGKALVVAERLADPGFLTQVLTMHGNELRKAGRVGAAIARTQRAVALAADARAGTAAHAVLARAVGEAGQADLFDTVIRGYRRHLDEVDGTGMLANPFTFREVQLRGLASTGRSAQAARLLDSGPDVPFAPQWSVIERITVGEVLLANGDRSGAEATLPGALADAERYRLPHQVQRAIRIATAYRIDDIAEAGQTMLTRLATRPSVEALS